jgi:hypothetical protein
VKTPKILALPLAVLITIAYAVTSPFFIVASKIESTTTKEAPTVE